MKDEKETGVVRPMYREACQHPGCTEMACINFHYGKGQKAYLCFDHAQQWEEEEEEA